MADQYFIWIVHVCGAFILHMCSYTSGLIPRVFFEFCTHVYCLSCG